MLKKCLYSKVCKGRTKKYRRKLSLGNKLLIKLCSCTIDKLKFFQQLVTSGKAFGGFASGCQPDGSGSADDDFYHLTIYENWSAANCAVRMGYAVSANSRYPEQAFKVLEQMDINDDVVNLLTWGIEGKHYVLDENGAVRTETEYKAR